MLNERSIFEASIEIADIQERKDYLDVACQGDMDLRRQVEILLNFYDLEPTFLNEASLLSARSRDVLKPAGHRVGRYILIEPIGEGGFGVVYRAQQTEPIERIVALKLIKPGMDTRHVIARFNAERQTLALMDHPYIARVLDGGSTDDGRPYFVMEFVDGEPITDFCDTNRFDMTERLRLFVRVCHAIQHAHQQGIIHRDIKPSNVLVSLNNGEAIPRVIDFGIGKAIGQQVSDSQMTRHGQTIGTPQYMSPEQADNSNVDARSDVYSLGIMLYEMLTGQTPLDKDKLKSASDEEFRRMIKENEAPIPSSNVDTVGEVAKTISDNRGTDPKQLRQLLRGELDWITLKAVKKEPNLRYESPISLAEDIDRLLNQQPVTAGPPSSVYRLRKFVVRNRGWVASLSAVAVSLLVGLTICLLMLVRLRDTVADLKTSRDEVLIQAEIAESNFEMVERMLTAIDPSTGNATNLTVLQMLDQYVADLPNHLADKLPQVRARTRTMLGTMYARLGEQHRADEFFVNAVEDRREMGDQRALAHALLERASNAMRCCYEEIAFQAASEAETLCKQLELDDLRAAEEIVEQSSLNLSLRGIIWEPMSIRSHHTVVQEVKEQLERHPDVLINGVVHHLIVSLYSDVGEFQLAEEMCRRGSDTSRYELVPPSNVITRTHFTLGYLAEMQGKQTVADEHFKLVLEQKDQPGLLNSTNKWIEGMYVWAILRRKDLSKADLKEAEHRAQEYVDLVESVQALPSITAMAYHVMAAVKEAQHDLTVAIEFQERALSECKKDGMPNNMLLQLSIEEQLARLYTKNDNSLAANQVVEQALEWRREQLPATHYQNTAAELKLLEFKVER